MNKRQKEYKERLSLFNRVAGQFKRYQDIDTSKYLEGVTTAKGVDRALKQMRFDYERPKIEERVKAYERRQYERYREDLEKEYRIESERAEKNADLAKKLNEYKTGFETFKERFDYGEMTETDFRELIDVWGGISEEVKEAYGGSDPKKSGYGNLVYTYKEIKDPMQRKNFVDILKEVQDANPGATQEELVNALYTKIGELNTAYDAKVEKEKDKRS